MLNVSSEVHGLAKKHLKKVRKSGPTNIMALCPFHIKADGTEERKPSFAMSLVTGLWFCHSCQASGNLYTFLRDIGYSRTKIELTYRPLIESASHAGPIDKFNALKPKSVFSVDPLPENLLGLFDHFPKSLIDAGFDYDTLGHFNVGFDMEHTRVTYPLRDLNGKLVGISGRAVTNSWPKYKLYTDEFAKWELPARPEPDKRAILWNAHAIFPQLYFQTNPEYLVVVEGFKACMWLWQAGIKNVVALLGTYLSNEQQWILERLGSEVRLFLDNNAPGQAGTLKAVEKLRRSMRVRVIEYPPRLASEENAQPDNCTVDEVLQQVNTATEYTRWLSH